MEDREEPLRPPGVDDLKAYMWHKGDLAWKLDALQESMLKTISASPGKTVLILSSRQIGKSYAAVVIALEFCIKNPGTIVRIIAPTLKQCSDIVNDNLNPLTLDAPKGMIERYKAEYRWKVGQSSLRLGALERAHVDNNRGGNASLVIYEESGFVKGDDFTYGVNSVLGPQLLRSQGYEYFISSPSEEPDHPLHIDILPKCELLGTAFRYTVYDSPSITQGMIDEAIRRCGGRDTDAFKREYLAEIIRPRSLVVVPDFDKKVHVQPIQIPQHCNMQVTGDWGGVRDLTVGLLHTYDYLLDQDLIFDERMHPANTSTEVIVGSLREMEASHTIHARNFDVPGQLIVDLAVSHNYDVRPPPKDDWQAAVNYLAVRFTQGKVLIHPRCKFLIQSLASGIFNKNRTDFERSVTLGHCDALAALMYAFRSQDRSTNPFPKLMPTQNTFALPKPDPDKLLAEAMNPGGFITGGIKKFGSFRR